MLLLSKSRFGPEKFAWTVSRVQNKENLMPEMGVDLVPHSSKAVAFAWNSLILDLISHS